VDSAGSCRVTESSCRHRRLKKCRVITEDAGFEVAQRRRRVEPKFLAQQDPKRLRPPKAPPLPATAIQGDDELLPEALPQGMPRDESF